jgi:hypothetical protein
MVGDGWLRDAHIWDDAHAHLAALVRGHRREQAQPDRIAERREHRRGPLGLLGGQGSFGQGRPARHHRTGDLGSSSGSALMLDTCLCWHVSNQRGPPVLKTTLPGVFAAGDVRSGSVKRVASAVGEGAMAIRLVHEHRESAVIDTRVNTASRSGST